MSCWLYRMHRIVIYLHFRSILSRKTWWATDCSHQNLSLTSQFSLPRLHRNQCVQYRSQSFWLSFTLLLLPSLSAIVSSALHLLLYKQRCPPCHHLFLPFSCLCPSCEREQTSGRSQMVEKPQARRCDYTRQGFGHLLPFQRRRGSASRLQWCRLGTVSSSGTHVRLCFFLPTLRALDGLSVFIVIFILCVCAYCTHRPSLKYTLPFLRHGRAVCFDIYECVFMVFGTCIIWIVSI